MNLSPWVLLLAFQVTVQKRASIDDGTLEHEQSTLANCDTKWPLAEAPIYHGLCLSIGEGLRKWLPGDSDAPACNHAEVKNLVEEEAKKIGQTLTDNGKAFLITEALGMGGLSAIVNGMTAADVAGDSLSYIATDVGEAVLGSAEAQQKLVSFDYPAQGYVESAAKKATYAQGALLALGIAADAIFWPITWGGCTLAAAGAGGGLIGAPKFMATTAYEAAKLVPLRTFFKLYENICDAPVELTPDTQNKLGDAADKVAKAYISKSAAAGTHMRDMVSQRVAEGTIPDHYGQADTQIGNGDRLERFKNLADLAAKSTVFEHGLYKSQALPTRKQLKSAWDTQFEDANGDDFNPMTGGDD